MGGKYLAAVKGIKTKWESEQNKNRRNKSFLPFLFYITV